MRIIIAIGLMTLFAFASPAYAQQNSSILNDKFITSQESIEATVVRVQPRNRTITVRGKNNGDERQFVVPEGVRLTVNGKEARIRDIRRGDNIVLTMKKKEERVVVDRVRIPKAPQSLAERRASPVYEAVPAMLPKTASSMPALILLGVFSLIGAAVVRRGLIRQ